MLEVFNNRAEHTHENEQFRRVVKIINEEFEKNGYDGILIGNPKNTVYSRFRADAILYYTNGLIIIDFKDYKGEVNLPDENNFDKDWWYNENLQDIERVIIKAGNSFINPYVQLLNYRSEFKKVLSKEDNLEKIKKSYITSLNIFSGPIELNGVIPKRYRWYKMTDEKNLPAILYDNYDNIPYSEKIKEHLKTIFPAPKYDFIQPVKKEIKKKVVIKPDLRIEKDIESKILEFFNDDRAGILVLESMEYKDRDNYLRFILSNAPKYKFALAEGWSHSARISRKIENRCGINTENIYSTIYSSDGKTEVKNVNYENGDIKDFDCFETIPLKINNNIPDNSVIVITEAHLINSSYFSENNVCFGTGKLLEDIITFINPDSNRKIIFIGDNNSLSYGDIKTSALNINNLKALYGENKKIVHCRKAIDINVDNGRDKLRNLLASSIENEMFNYLKYSYDQKTLNEVNADELKEKLKDWFAADIYEEPDKAVLYYKKEDCNKINKYIKKSIKKNGETVNVGDLLIVNKNSVIINDESIEDYTYIVNGMYLKVLEKLETITKTIPLKRGKDANINQTLNFVKIKVDILNAGNEKSKEIWILENYLNIAGELDDLESLALRILKNEKINEYKKEMPFNKSKYFNFMKESMEYKELSEYDKDMIENYWNDLRKFKKENKAAKALIKKYKKKYEFTLQIEAIKKDPLLNAVFVKYGWSITVHKAVASNFNEIIINGNASKGKNNESYYRWLYTGITSGRKVNLANPTIITPFKECKFVNNVEPVNSKIKNCMLNGNNNIYFYGYEVDNEYKRFVQNINNENVIGVICELSKKIYNLGYKLNEVNKNGEYSTVISYNSESCNDLVLNISNKGARYDFGVSKISIISFDGDDNSKNMLEEIIESLFEIKVNDWRKNIYTSLKNELATLNIELKLYQSVQNEDRFIAYLNNEALKFKLSYGTSKKSHTLGRFLSFTVSEKNDDTIFDAIYNVIKEGE